MNKRTYLAGLAFLAVLLVVCNIAFFHTSGTWQAFWHVVSFTGLYLVYKETGLTPDGIGLDRKYIKNGLSYGALASLALFVILFVLYLADAQTFQDSRYHNGLWGALYAALILVPVQTVIFEEITFRGMLPALVSRLASYRWLAAAVSSVAFGLWHVLSAGSFGTLHVASAEIPQAITIFIIICFTGLAGLFLYGLRQRSKSLLAPMLVHWSANACAILFAALSWR